MHYGGLHLNSILLYVNLFDTILFYCMIIYVIGIYMILKWTPLAGLEPASSRFLQTDNSLALIPAELQRHIFCSMRSHYILCYHTTFYLILLKPMASPITVNEILCCFTRYKLTPYYVIEWHNIWLSYILND